MLQKTGPSIVEKLRRNLPDELFPLPRFMLWRSEEDPADPTKRLKVPYYAAGGPRRGNLDSPEDLARLVTFEVAASHFRPEVHDGIGFAAVPGDDLRLFDLDHCLDDLGELNPDHAGAALVNQAIAADAYTEVTPSGHGLRIIARAGAIQRPYSKGGLEVWPSGRFLTLTGESWGKPGNVVDLSSCPAVEAIATASRTPVGDRDDFASDEVTPDTLADLHDALAWLCPDERELWIAVGQALKTLPHHLGRDLWKQWSSQSSKWKPGDEAKWDGFVGIRTGFASIFSKAQEAGWKNPRGNQRRDPADAFGNEPDEESEPTGDKDEGLGLIDYTGDFQPTEFVLDGFWPVGLTVVAGVWGAGKRPRSYPSWRLPLTSPRLLGASARTCGGMSCGSPRLPVNRMT